ncbi:phytoene desaturase family protein [Brevibacillus invocatus]|uniref:phytoene desaturase family protein n=1 Tax=Brevibacillus invocatus TaxID=173959 RepID=UPI002040B2C6|nr:FAD-dependent oxidoreductase [Brevibacillus invocatus]MCM3079663.1 FAD-dependent oxidoreductase [Brevibacillus invocatus]MCM3431127.1 FAD-dependent oxidoreductase [Brevibacillus invocatus]
MKHIVVVGGGIAGIVASLLLAKKGYQVDLVEKEDSCGGLLRSFQTEDGVSFDLGTHILSQTMISELDEILFGDLEETEWEIFDVFKTGNYFRGKLYKQNQMINAADLPADIYLRGLVDLLQTEPFEKPAQNLKSFTEKQYGLTFSQHIFAPLMRKLQGCELEELHQDAHILFGYTRLIVANEHASRELKKSSFYDGKISYTSYNEGVSPSKKYYPKERQGIGKWVDHLVDKAIDAGVAIRTGRYVTQVGLDNGKVTSIRLDTGETIGCSYVIWTLPSIGLLNAASIQVHSKPPVFRQMSLHHYVFDRPFLTDNHYVYCNDDQLKSFRVTLYPNIINVETASYNCTVEVLSEWNGNIEDLNEIIKRELITMGIVEDEASALYQFGHEVKNGFPIFTNEFVETQRDQREIVQKSFNNVSMIGKGAGVAFFMNEVLIQVYREVEHICNHLSNLSEQKEVQTLPV